MEKQVRVKARKCRKEHYTQRLGTTSQTNQTREFNSLWYYKYRFIPRGVCSISDFIVYQKRRHEYVCEELAELWYETISASVEQVQTGI